uniref:THO complex subunit 7 n=2 Tax=Macrostomum lignano TaxID=282301 RepID=A0A1I8IWR3_9PLAT
MPLQAVTEEEVIKRRLLVEGDSGREDKKLQYATRQLAAWLEAAPAPAKDGQTLQQLLVHVAQLEAAMGRAARAEEVNRTEQQHYRALGDQVAEEIQAAEARIVQLQSELETAMQCRRNRQEYDTQAGVILGHPDRASSEARLAEMGARLASLRQTDRRLGARLEARRRQCRLLAAALRDFSSAAAFEEDEGGESGDATDLEVEPPDASVEPEEAAANDEDKDVVMLNKPSASSS